MGAQTTHSLPFPYHRFLVVECGESLITCDTGFHDSLRSSVSPPLHTRYCNTVNSLKAELFEGFVKDEKSGCDKDEGAVWKEVERKKKAGVEGGGKKRRCRSREGNEERKEARSGT